MQAHGRWLHRREHPPCGRNPPSAGERPKLAQYPTDCGHLDIGRQLRASARACRRAKPPHARSKLALPDEALLQPPSCLSPSPDHCQSRASPLLQALSQTCWCFFSGLSGLGGRSKQETPRPPPGKCLQRAPPARGAEHRCELRALLAGRGSAAAAAAALQALPDFCPNRLRFLLALRGIAGAADLLPASRSAFALKLAAGAPRC